MIEALSTVDPWRIRVFPDDPGLRLASRPVAEFDEAWLVALIIRMGQAMHANGGVGLAAPQLGVQSRVIVLRDDAPKKKGKKAKPANRLSCFAMVNPRIVEHTEEMLTSGEGCLSIPGVRVAVERHRGVVVEHETPTGETFTVPATDEHAIVIQHEIDHLDGKLLIDHMELSEQRRLIRDLHGLKQAERDARRAALQQALGNLDLGDSG